MKNAFIMAIVCTVLVAALAVGLRPQHPADETASPPPPQKSDDTRQSPPHIGRIQVLNGCGTPAAAKTVVEFLRARKFDVKDCRNAKTSNYTETLVVSRVKNQAVARQVAQALGIPSVVLMRNGDEMYDVTVYVGTDFQEHVR